MATARKKTPASKPARKATAAKAKASAPKAKAAAAKKPAGKPVKASAVKTGAKVTKPASKPSSKAATKPAPKAAVKPAAKPPLKAAAKAPAKPVAKAGPRVIGKPAVKGTPGKVVAVAPAKPVSKAPPRLVPATADAKAAHLALSKPAKTTGGKSKLVAKAPPEVRPLGVLPPESMARPKTHTAPQRSGSVPARSQPSSGQKPVVAKKGDDRLTEADLKHFEQRLLQERVKVMKEMGHLENTLLKVNPRDAAGELSGYSFHMADAGTDSMEREKAFDIASKEGRLLMEIDDALRRLYGGNYGICEASGKPISRARLEALPWARLSIEEQAKYEREQRAGRAAAPGTE